MASFSLRKSLRVLLAGLYSLTLPLSAGEGHFINPITDVCWGCLFPIHVGGVNVTPEHSDFVSYSYKDKLCVCAGAPPKAGVPLAFWEPTALIDVTRTPYKLTALGGISIGTADVRKRGGIAHLGDGGRTSFYNVHYYKFPILAWLDILPGFSCAEQGSVDICYLSEFDPFWDDDEWSAVLNPEVLIFANPLAQAACIADCTASTLNKPNDKLFWCAGCEGSLYPFVGHVPHHVGGIQASSLLVHRLLAKLHSIGMMWGFEQSNYCEKTLFPRIKKTLYKTQLTHPVANTSAPCHALGKSDAVWGVGKSFPYGGEDFVYLLWVKKQCCLDAVEAAAAASGVTP